MEKYAVLNKSRTHRYVLQRRWGNGRLMVWVMLNPSTADETVDDPTIRRCKGFALSGDGPLWGGIHVVNVMAFRATSPKECLAADDPFGPLNAEYLHEAAHYSGGNVVCAWGAKAPAGYVKLALEALRPAKLFCLGTTKDGSPKHPLYLAGDTEIVRYRP